MATIEAYPNGTQVNSRLKMGGVGAGITKAIMITGENTITYKVGYFLNGDYKEVWMDEKELEFDISPPFNIGFKIP